MAEEVKKETEKTKSEVKKETKKSDDVFYQVVDCNVLDVSDSPDEKKTQYQLVAGEIAKEVPDKSTKEMACIKVAGIEGYAEKKFLKKL